MEQITRLRIYRHSSNSNSADLEYPEYLISRQRNCNWMQILWKIWNILTFVPVVPINIPPHKCVKSAKTRRYPRDSRDNLAAEGSPKSRIGHQRRTIHTIIQPNNHTQLNKNTHNQTTTHMTHNQKQKRQPLFSSLVISNFSWIFI